MKVIRALLKPLSFVPALCLMYMIFSFSAQDSVTSSALSYKVSYKIVETGAKVLGENLEPYQIDSLATRFHGLVRKIAHMTEYFALAVAVAFPLYVYGLRGIWLMLVAGFICVAFACGDEYHQSFVSGRSPSKRDVAIDSFGIFWGIILARIVGWTGRKTIFRPFSDEALQKRDEKKARKKQKKYVSYSGNAYDNPNSYGTYSNNGYETPRIRLHKTDTRHSQEMTIISLNQALILIRVIQTDTHRIQITPTALHSTTAILTRIKPVDMRRIRITLHSKTATHHTRKWMMTTVPTSFPRTCLSEN